MKSNEILTIVIVSLVVAIIASFATVQISGNVVGVKSGTNYKVYTASEIDAKLNTMSESYLLEVSAVTQQSGINYTTIKNSVTGNEVCKRRTGDKCQIGNVVMTIVNANPDTDVVTLKSSFNSDLHQVYVRDFVTDTDKWFVAEFRK